MSVSWIWKVLRKKGCSSVFTSWLSSIYELTDSFVIPIVNNEPQARMINKRKNIRQGDSISTCLYNYGADALLIALSKRLKGVEYFKCSTIGPHHPVLGKPRPVSDRLRVLGFVDDCKAVLTSVQDFLTLDATIKTLEKST